MGEKRLLVCSSGAYLPIPVPWKFADLNISVRAFTPGSTLVQVLPSSFEISVFTRIGSRVPSFPWLATQKRIEVHFPCSVKFANYSRDFHWVYVRE